MLARLLRTDRDEILDREGLNARGRAILADLDRWNRLSGWYRFHVRRVLDYYDVLGRPRPFRVLDVGTGSGGLLALLATTFGEQGIDADLVGLDRDPGYVAFARERLGDRARVVEGDATALPFDAGAFD